jgi:ribosomal protein S18 acetylase RimI-like enzyme
MNIRAFIPPDIQPLISIVTSTSVFKDIEIQVARELMEACAHDPSNNDYIISVAEDEGGKVRGYYCVGPVPLTDSTFDLYWIAVDPIVHNRGVGKKLLDHCEKNVQSRAGKLILAQTSSLPRYEPTRVFYQRNNYHQECRIQDYYGDGDDLVIFSKHLREVPN